MALIIGAIILTDPVAVAGAVIGGILGIAVGVILIAVGVDMQLDCMHPDNQQTYTR
jgi:hypothetical protein